MVVSRRSPNIDSNNSIEVCDNKFEKIKDLKYLGVNISCKNDTTIEIKNGLRGEICYFNIIKLLRPKLLFKESKILLYHSYL